MGSLLCSNSALCALPNIVPPYRWRLPKNPATTRVAGLPAKCRGDPPKLVRSLPANSDPFCQCAHLADRAFLQSFARDGIRLIAALGKIPRHGLSLDRHGAYSPGLSILKNRGVGQKSIDPAAQQQLPQGFRAFQLQANVELCAFSGRGVLDQLARPIVLAGHDQRNVPETDYFEAALLQAWIDRKSTRLNSSHLVISYAVFCLKKKNNKIDAVPTSENEIKNR